MKLQHLLASVFAACFCSASQSSEPYPSRPVKLVIGYAAGGGSDLVGRMAGDQLARKLGVPVVVENIAGAAQNVAASRVARSAPDGYTIFMSSPALTINPWMYKETGYKATESFQPVGLFGQAPNALVVPSSLGVSSVGELVTRLRAQGGGNFSSAGIGTTHHLSAELFKQLTKLDGLEHIPYKSAAEALSAVMRGEVQFTFVSVPSARSLIGNDKVRILGLTGAEKSSLMSGIPMLSDAGLKGMDIGTWYGLLLPAGTPMTVVKAVHTALVTDNADFVGRLAGVGVDYQQTTPEAFGAFIKTDLTRWGKLLETVKFERQ